LNEKFGNENPVTSTRGKVLEHLGMRLDYTTKGVVKISMYDYIGSVKTPAAAQLFNVNKDG